MWCIFMCNVPKINIKFVLNIGRIPFDNSLVSNWIVQLIKQFIVKLGGTRSILAWTSPHPIKFHKVAEIVGNYRTE